MFKLSIINVTNTIMEPLLWGHPISGGKGVSSQEGFYCIVFIRQLSKKEKYDRIVNMYF